MRCYVLMGVSGCGKTSVGLALAKPGDITFVDGDALHPPANIAKMASGTPLNDVDRAPWLADVGRTLAETDGPVAIGCSALKKKYRDWIRDAVGEPVGFIHLDAPKDVLEQRVNDRDGHFMPAGLLDSQLAALEPLDADELGSKVDISKPLPDVIQQSDTYIRKTLT